MQEDKTRNDFIRNLVNPRSPSFHEDSIGFDDIRIITETESTQNLPDNKFVMSASENIKETSQLPGQVCHL